MANWLIFWQATHNSPDHSLAHFLPGGACSLSPEIKLWLMSAAVCNTNIVKCRSGYEKFICISFSTNIFLSLPLPETSDLRDKKPQNYPNPFVNTLKITYLVLENWKEFCIELNGFTGTEMWPVQASDHNWVLPADWGRGWVSAQWDYKGSHSAHGENNSL